MGKLMVIDGLDGSGKHTQFELLYDALNKLGKNVHKISFPRYNTPGCVFVEKYLSGEFGMHANDTSAYASSLFFGLDRFYSYKTEWKSIMDCEDSIILADRYTSANAVHQLSKLPKDQWEEFLSWLWDTEFEKLSLPRPDAVIYLKMPPEVSFELIRKRSETEGRVMDIHERDNEYLYKSYEAALFASQKLCWKTIDCIKDGFVRTREDIHNELFTYVMSLLEGKV